MKFHYTARDHSGSRSSGQIEADGKGVATRLLEDRDLFPIDVWSVDDSQGSSSFRRNIPSRDLGIMYGQLSDLLGSGVPLLRALKSLFKSTVNKRLADVLRDIHNEVADGKSLYESMAGHEDIFPTLHTVMVQAGERASFLEEVLASLSVFLERLDELRNKVLGALVYPTMLVFLGSAVMVGALIFFVPKFEPMLADVDKPMPTEVVFFLSEMLRNHWIILLASIAGAITFFWSVLQSQAGKQAIERWRLKIPVAGNALKMVAITRFCRILGTMLSNGVPILQALAISRDATGSALLSENINEALESVRAGEPLTEPLKAGGLFPEQVLAMISVAEESNQLQKVLLQIADSVERRTNQQVDQAVRLIEPVILCLVAAGIGFLALGLLLPIFTMASSLGAN
ncbi:MAG: type II secretion system F family protein [Verrucomicrobiota bacterium]|mgnify:CR=1 FL=1|jgi:general secretion pathway protein F/type IV pilus assembly protein PilC|nr:type II secretion system F family protein [Verrucomicrobiota bacterium]MED5453479.1 type II secretion system F family protein [Verrucomicrobiota bacterium]|tara:strand:+ start:1708 stop:2907 length:1200 start_codon:yes stop_codon:yes gene_type:complete